MKLESSTQLAPPLVVREACDADHARWNAYVFAHPHATFFHRFEWRDLIAREFGHRPYFLIAERGDDLVGILPLAHMKSALFGSSMVSLPFCVYGGPIADDPVVGTALDARAIASAESVGAGRLEYRSLSRDHPEWPSSELYVTFRRELAADEDTNMKAIPRKQRAMVRKGIANGLVATVEDSAAFFPIYADNVHRHGTPGMSARWFRALQDTFGRDCDVMVVRDAQGNPLSAVLSFYFRNEALPYYAGDYQSARGLAANDFKYWRLMCHAVERGCTLFDYGRSKIGTGPYAFKKNWGFEPTPLPYQYRLLTSDAIPQNNPLNPKYRLMIETWRRLPRPVVNWLGPRVVRGLG